MSTSRRSVAAEIVRVCQRLYERGLIAGPDGNVSVRIDDNVILATPSGASKVDITAADIVEIDMRANLLRGKHPVSSEIAMHLGAYRVRRDARAIVHAHPPVATGLAIAGVGIMDDVLPEVILQMGSVPVVPFAMPGTPALARRLAPYWKAHDAVLLANHGATTIGPTLTVAHQRMESLEHAARILFTARLAGRVKRLSPRDAHALDARRRKATRMEDE